MAYYHRNAQRIALKNAETKRLRKAGSRRHPRSFPTTIWTWRAAEWLANREMTA